VISKFYIAGHPSSYLHEQPWEMKLHQWPNQKPILDDPGCLSFPVGWWWWLPPKPWSTLPCPCTASWVDGPCCHCWDLAWGFLASHVVRATHCSQAKQELPSYIRTCPDPAASTLPSHASLKWLSALPLSFIFFFSHIPPSFSALGRLFYLHSPVASSFTCAPALVLACCISPSGMQKSNKSPWPWLCVQESAQQLQKLTETTIFKRCNQRVIVFGVTMFCSALTLKPGAKRGSRCWASAVRCSLTTLYSCSEYFRCVLGTLRIPEVSGSHLGFGSKSRSGSIVQRGRE